MEQNQNILSRATRGLFSGLRTGALMMGIFVLVSATIASTGLLPMLGLAAAGTAAPSFAAAALSVLPGAAIGVIATALFGAVNTALSSAPARETIHIRGRDGVMRSAQITQAPTVAMPIIHSQAAGAEKDHTRGHEHAAVAHEQGSWAERVGQNHKGRIAEIIANGSLSDQDRAAALLAEREQQHAGEHGRA